MNCGEFIGELFRARDIVHIEHLQSKHWGGHMALNELYESMEDHIDTVAELRLARGPVEIKVDNIPSQIDVLKYLESSLDPMITMAKKQVDKKGYNDISAEIDMIKTDVMKAIYKLKNLTKQTNHSQTEDEECDDHEEDAPSGGILIYKNPGKGMKKRMRKQIKKR